MSERPCHGSTTWNSAKIENDPRLHARKVQTEGEKAVKIDPRDRLMMIAKIIEDVDDRCMSADGPVTHTRDEITDEEIRKIYKLALLNRLKEPNVKS